MQSNPYSKMRENAILTAPKEELTLILYDGALKFINQAQSAIEARDNEKAHERLVRVQDIIREFQLTLNRSYEVSKDFDTMYEYIYRRLVDANINKDPEIINECSDLIRGMRDMWKEAMHAARGGTGQARADAATSTGTDLQG
ncbi:MAG: flagellar export chaperone FliS [Defluviitaleaceae bacterium]|nr:flagellar export chaperone FliS [Defluviitaleaceae bacterium]